MKLYKKQYTFSAFYTELYYCGIGILDPTTYNYEDLFADGFIKVVDEIVNNGVVYSSRVCTCKVHFIGEKTYFYHRNKRYYLDDFMRCNI